MPSNLLLNRLPATVRSQLLPQFQLLELAVGSTLADQDTPIQALLFPLSGCLSLQRHVDAHAPLQLGFVGRESCVGAALLTGPARHALRVEVLGAGQALCLPRRALTALVAEPGGHGGALRELLGAVLRAQPQRLAQEALCCRFHALSLRLARWLLERSERSERSALDAGGARISATHQTLAHLLGVRREAVTSAASALQRQGLLLYRRGQVEILDRKGLALRACSCYRRP